MFKVPAFSCLLTGDGFSYEDRRRIKNKNHTLPTFIVAVDDNINAKSY